MSTDCSDDDAIVPADTRGSRPGLVAEIVTYEDRPAECTIYPPDLPLAEHVITWITAREGSFVALSAMR